MRKASGFEHRRSAQGDTATCGTGLRSLRAWRSEVRKAGQPLGEVVAQSQLIDVPEHEVDSGDGGHCFGSDLRVTAGHGHDTARVATLSGPDLVPAGLIALGRDRAGVDDPDVGGIFPGTRRYPAAIRPSCI